jgi:hypothetical protein
MTDDRYDAAIEQLLREFAPQVLGAVTRRFRDFSLAEDANSPQRERDRRGRSKSGITREVLIVCFARLIRCAIVASGTRKAFAISAVVNPHWPLSSGRRSGSFIRKDWRP